MILEKHFQEGAAARFTRKLSWKYHPLLVIPTGAKRSGGTCASLHAEQAQLEAPPSPLSSRPERRDLRFYGPFLEMFLSRAELQQHVIDEPCCANPTCHRHQSAFANIRYVLKRLRINDAAVVHLDPRFPPEYP